MISSGYADRLCADKSDWNQYIDKDGTGPRRARNQNGVPGDRLARVVARRVVRRAARQWMAGSPARSAGR